MNDTPKRIPWDRDAMEKVLVYHARMENSSCACGWAVLGHSHCIHQIEVYEDLVGQAIKG